MIPTRAWGATSPTTPFSALQLDRRDPLPGDVRLDILFCGVCHSDIHTARGEWPGTNYPCVPGHEIVGRVAEVGRDVKHFKVGDIAAVGCMVDSCRECASCRDGEEQYCEPGFTGTYNSPDRHTGGHTFGGYTSTIVVDQHFVLRMPKSLDPAAAAPLLCAGITTYSPLRHWNVGKGTRVGVIGIGGLGHMGVKLAAAMGAHVTVFTSSASKRADAEKLGAHDVVVTPRGQAPKLNSGVRPLEFILDTVSVPQDLDALAGLLGRNGVMTLVGAPAEPHQPSNAISLIWRRRSIAGSLIGGIAETQEMLDFCDKHGIVSDIEMIRIQQIDEAYERMLKGDVKYRFVIDNASLAAGR